MAKVLDWQLRDVLLAYLAWLRREARSRYQHAQLLWGIIATQVTKPPEHPTLPPVLEGDR
ncbi:MAG TPA: hypothetical protein VFK04_12980 [Gemmatimonadaceae bacterium]|nr:hypothetical protein [Gemmatimonadaceae bacterium]